MKLKGSFSGFLVILSMTNVWVMIDFRPVLAVVKPWIDLEIEVVPEHPGVGDLVNVTLSFTFGTGPPNVEEFGPVNRDGNVFSTNVTVYVPAPGEWVWQWVHTDSHMYSLDNLSLGEYEFHIYVQTIHWNEEYWLEEIIPFTVAIRVPDDYATIQEAINAANTGDNIFVHNGTYHENVVLNKSVSILSEDSFSTIVHGTIYIQASNTRISECTVTDGQGIRVENVKHVEVSHVISRNSSNFGILLSNTTDSRILSNSFHSSYYDRICLDHTSHNNTIRLNDIQHFNRDGVGIYSSQYNLVEANTIVNGDTGLHMNYASHNTIKNNTIMNCTVSVWSEHSHNNTLYHNNFINNTTGSATPDSENNCWDNGCEGNYWSNYNGSDLDGDGIGDTPYIIGQNNTDNLPLMNRYWNPCDINHDLKVDIVDVAASAKAFGTEPGDERWNCHVDITGPTPLEPDKEVNIMDIGLIARHFGKTDA